MSELWYYRKSGRQFGPMTHSDLQQIASDGGLFADDEVRSGHSGWQPAADVFDISSPIGDHPESSMLDSFQEVLGAAPAAEVHEAVPEEPDTAGRYYCRLDGEQAGPFSVEQMQSLVDEGQLHKHDRILLEGSRCWLPCSELQELDFSTSSADNADSYDDDEFDNEMDEDLVDDDDDEDDDDAYDDDDDDDDSYYDDEDDGEDDFDIAAEASEFEDPPRSAGAQTPALSARDSAMSGEAAAATVAAPVSAVMPSTSTPPAPTRPKPSRQARRASKSESSSTITFTLPPARFVFGGLGFVAIVFAVGWLWPKGDGNIHGQVAIDGTPVPVGIVSITPQEGTKGPSLSLPVVDGRFEATTDVKLVEGSYRFSVTVGNPLKMPVPELKGTPLDKLNGSRFVAQINTKTLKTPSIDLTFKASDAVGRKKKRKRR